MISVALTTATSLTDLEAPVTYTTEDADGVEQTYDVSVGAVIFDASVPLVFEEEEEEEEEAEDSGASFNSLKWGALALSTLMLAQWTNQQVNSDYGKVDRLERFSAYRLPDVPSSMFEINE